MTEATMRRSRGRKSESASGCIPEPLIIFALLFFFSFSLSLVGRTCTSHFLLIHRQHKFSFFVQLFFPALIRSSFVSRIYRPNRFERAAQHPKSNEKKKIKSKVQRKLFDVVPKTIGRAEAGTGKLFSYLTK